MLVGSTKCFKFALIMDPTAPSKYDVIESAVFISADKRGARPGAWADDEYTGIDFMTVTMTAADQHEEANAQRDQVENPDFNGADSVPEEVVGGASGSGAEHLDDGDDKSANGAAPPGAPPDYRASEASAMVEEDSESEEEQRPRRPRSRYVDDEADDTPELYLSGQKIYSLSLIKLYATCGRT